MGHQIVEWLVDVGTRILDYCPLMGTMIESRRATDTSWLKKAAVMGAIPVMTAIGVGLVMYGAHTQWQKSIEKELHEHQVIANDRMAEMQNRTDKKIEDLEKRMGRLEDEIRDTHKEIVQWMIKQAENARDHAENDRKEFNNLRRK